jgi:hypothetical protein
MKSTEKIKKDKIITSKPPTPTSTKKIEMKKTQVKK